MNKLPQATREQIIMLLCEGNSLRAITRITGVSINTVTKLLVDAGRACKHYHDKYVRNLKSERVQCDEIWSFIYSKEKNATQDSKIDNNAGDCYTWTAIDADSKLILSYLVGQRTEHCANYFMYDVALRVSNRIQLTTDGLSAYREAVRKSFGRDIDFAQLIKIYGSESGKGNNERKYSPIEYTGSKKITVRGEPDMDHVSTSYVERQNLTMRMHMRRFTRLTNGFSKKLENHACAIALHFFYYNFVRIHKTLRVTPAMAAGLKDDIVSVSEIIRIADEQYLANI